MLPLVRRGLYCTELNGPGNGGGWRGISLSNDRPATTFRSLSFWCGVILCSYFYAQCDISVDGWLVWVIFVVY